MLFKSPSKDITWLWLIDVCVCVGTGRRCSSWRWRWPSDCCICWVKLSPRLMERISPETLLKPARCRPWWGRWDQHSSLLSGVLARKLARLHAHRVYFSVLFKCHSEKVNKKRYSNNNSILPHWCACKHTKWKNEWINRAQSKVYIMMTALRCCVCSSSPVAWAGISIPLLLWSSSRPSFAMINSSWLSRSTFPVSWWVFQACYSITLLFTRLILCVTHNLNTFRDVRGVQI